MRDHFTRAATAGLAFVGALAASAPAFAHASLETGQASANATYKAVMRIPHGCEGKPTVALTIDIPDGVIAVKPMPKAGWALEIETGAYDKTYDYHGTPMSEGVRRIRWTGGELPDAFYDEFVFHTRITGGLPDTTLAFPTVQDCPDGAKVSWTEIAAPGQIPHDLAHPAPTLTVAAGKDGHEHHHAAAAGGPISVEGAFARATPGAARNGGAFLMIRNAGSTADRLIGATTDVAARAELHTHLHEDGVMKMRPIEAVEVPAGGEASLQPGGDHIMLLGLKAPLKEGESFEVTLIFETAGEVTVTVPVGAIGAMGSPGAHHQGMHKKH